MACNSRAPHPDAPQSELRAMFDNLQLEVVYHPAESAVDVTVTLYDAGDGGRDGVAQVCAEDWSAWVGRPRQDSNLRRTV